MEQPPNILEETRKAIKRVKNGIGKNSVESIALPSLDAKQAEAAGAFISAARAVALAHKAPEALHDEIYAHLHEVARGYDIKSTPEGYAVQFRNDWQPVFGSKDDYHELTAALPVYEIEKALPFVEKSVYVPQRQRIDGRFNIPVDFKDGEGYRSAAALMNRDPQITLMAAHLVERSLEAHGHDASRTMQLYPEGLPITNFAGNTDFGQSMQDAGSKRPASYPVVLVEHDLYEQLMREETHHKSRCLA